MVGRDDVGLGGGDDNAADWRFAGFGKNGIVWDGIRLIAATAAAAAALLLLVSFRSFALLLLSPLL